MEEPMVHQPDRRLQGKELEIRLIVPCQCWLQRFPSSARREAVPKVRNMGQCSVIKAIVRHLANAAEKPSSWVWQEREESSLKGLEPTSSG